MCAFVNPFDLCVSVSMFGGLLLIWVGISISVSPDSLESDEEKQVSVCLVSYL